MSDLKMEPQARTLDYYARRYKSLDEEALTLVSLWKGATKPLATFAVACIRAAVVVGATK